MPEAEPRHQCPHLAHYAAALRWHDGSRWGEEGWYLWTEDRHQESPDLLALFCPGCGQRMQPPKEIAHE